MGTSVLNNIGTNLTEKKKKNCCKNYTKSIDEIFLETQPTKNKSNKDLWQAKE